jgi:acetyl esterase/lipase
MTEIAAPAGWVERVVAAFLRGFLRVAFKPVIGPPFGAAVQRAWINVLAFSMPGRSGVLRDWQDAGGVAVEITAPKANANKGVILYLHGGAFCLASPKTHRSITSHLAFESGMAVWTPDYRLAPEAPYPAALEDIATVYRHLRSTGVAASQIVLAGDSAGATLALALAIQLRDQQQPMPACVMLISPVTDPDLTGPTMHSRISADPMIQAGWLRQGLRWYGCPAGTANHAPLITPLHGLPPLLIQVGDQELLLSDSTRLAQHAGHCGVDCRIEIYLKRWHVFHLQSFYLRSSVMAIRSMAAYAKKWDAS